MGVYQVLECISPTAYRLNILTTWQVHNVFHASLISQTKVDTIPGCFPAPKPVIRIADQELWVINKFITHSGSEESSNSKFIGRTRRRKRMIGVTKTTY
jgi:hypothetical protein